MISKTVFTCMLLMIISSHSIAYDNLRVRNPQASWYSTQGTIEKAVISVKPQGLYMEVGLYLTFSARGWTYGSTDSLEVEFYFDLPENSIVHDSWLWVGEEIIRGEIMDKWTASAIYEDIVKRRRDPSILFKRSARGYELRIYPMLATETRKVKITYLVPAQWNANTVMAPLPTNLLRTSKYPLSVFYLLTWLDEPWKSPSIAEFPDIFFTNHSDPTFGNYVRADIPPAAIQSSINFAVASPLDSGIFLSKYDSGNEQFYQLAFLPAEALNISATSKAAILFDYDMSNSNVLPGEILNTVKSVLHSSFAETDSFNLIFSQLNIKRASESWLPADSATIEQIFASLGDNPISSYSNLPSLMANGIEFVKSNGNNASIILVSCSDQVGDYKVANQLITDLMALMDSEIPIHIADFQDRDFTYYYIAGRSYRGNEYFYTNISRLTAANYFSVQSGYTFSEVVNTTLNSIGGFVNSFDLYTSLENGYCYGRYNISRETQSTYLDRPVLQIGKYQGTFPFVLELSGEFESQVFSQEIEINEENIHLSDSLAEEIWTGKYIQYLESQEQTNDVINEIVDYSISDRVLSIYSAFLCLEPQRGGQVCYDCMDETELVAIQEQITTIQGDSLLTAYPNPFNNQVKISVNVSNLSNRKDVTIKIYDILGQVVKNFQLPANFSQNIVNFLWTGENDKGADVSSGTYFLIMQTPEMNYGLKLLYMR